MYSAKGAIILKRERKKMNGDFIISEKDKILITGSNGFIGSRVVKTLLEYGFVNLRCFVRPSSNLKSLNEIIASNKDTIEIVQGNLLSPMDCKKAVKDVSVIFHLAAGIEKTFPGCYMNSVITTRNLLESVLEEKILKRFLTVSSFAVYSTRKIRRGGLLDENCELESDLVERNEGYTYGKAKQDEFVIDFGKKHGIPYVIVRPGAVYGYGKGITSRVGLDTFGIFMHLGGKNRIPFTYVDNCADVMVLAGLKEGVDGEVFNVVDDDLPRSRKFLKMYKKNVRNFKSVFIPYKLFYFLSFLWEKYSKWSNGQIPLAFSRNRCRAYYKGNRYSNEKAKRMLGWKQKIPTEEGMKMYFEYQKMKGKN
jgi:nucleoside-diphosphate-sugar epimerase